MWLLSHMDLFQLSHVPPSAAADDTLQFLQTHGFFYLEDAEIGEKVKNLYETHNIRSKLANLDYFMPVLENKPRLKPILDSYSIRQPHIHFPWGTVPGVYYNWMPKSDENAKNKLTVYTLGPGSQYFCLDGSLEINSDGEIDKEGFGVYQYPESVAEDYAPKEIFMAQGGV